MTGSVSWARPLALLSTLLCACGVAPGPGYAPLSLTLRGAISGDGPAPELGEVRVALAWIAPTAGPAGRALRVAEDLALRSALPARFELELRALPPEDSLATLAGGARQAEGVLLLYEDRDGDGQLGLRATRLAPAADRLLGTAERLSLLYYEGAPPATAWIAPARGFNLHEAPSYAGPSVGCDERCVPGPIGEPRLLPLDTPLPLRLTGAPALPRHLCADPGAAAEVVTCSGAACLPPPGATVVCTGDGLSYVFQLCPSDQGLCNAWSCRYGGGTRTAGRAPPGWPCPEVRMDEGRGG